MEDSEKKKRIIYLIILILTLITMIISTTIAYFSYIDSQKQDSTKLYSGTLKISYVDGIYIENPALYPLSNVTYNTKDKVYRNTFTISSYGTLDQKLKITLIINKNEFAPNELKYSIYNETGKEISTGYVQKEGKLAIADDLYLESNDSTNYTLIIWLDDKNYLQNESMGKNVSGSIEVNATQIKY